MSENEIIFKTADGEIRAVRQKDGTYTYYWDGLTLQDQYSIFEAVEHWARYHETVKVAV